jgi:hypothetical protein
MRRIMRLADGRRSAGRTHSYADGATPRYARRHTLPRGPEERHGDGAERRHCRAAPLESHAVPGQRRRRGRRTGHLVRGAPSGTLRRAPDPGDWRRAGGLVPTARHPRCHRRRRCLLRDSASCDARSSTGTDVEVHDHVLHGLHRPLHAAVRAHWRSPCEQPYQAQGSRGGGEVSTSRVGEATSAAVCGAHPDCVAKALVTAAALRLARGFRRSRCVRR